jgi:death-on-curing protein
LTDPARFLTVEDLVSLNEEVLAYGGGTHGVRYENGLHYAVDRPFLVFGGQPVFPSPYDKAAALVESLIRSHPFVDGNKRTALVAGLTLLEMFTGRSLDIPAEESAQACVAVAENEWGAAEFSLWLREKVESEADPALYGDVTREIRGFIEDHEDFVDEASALALGRVFTQGAAIFTTISEEVIEATNHATSAKNALAAAIVNPATPARRLHELEAEEKRASEVNAARTAASQELNVFLQRVEALRSHSGLRVD